MRRKKKFKMISYYCRFNKNHLFKNQRGQYQHERRCPDKTKSNMKECPYNPIHIFPKSTIEKHILKCVDRLRIEMENKRIEDEMIENTRIREENSKAFLNNDYYNKNDYWDSKPIKVELNENVDIKKDKPIEKNFGNEDLIFKSAYI